MRFAIFITAVLILASGCTRPDKAKHILEQNGYKDVQMTGYRFFGCGEKDSYSDGFIATSPSGQRVTGVVCGGFTKGSTIRFD